MIWIEIACVALVLWCAVAVDSWVRSYGPMPWDHEHEP
jgi:hypothetical protein